MGKPTNPSAIAKEIAEEVKKLDVEQEDDIQRICDEIMGQHRLNKMEKMIVRSFLDELLDCGAVEPSDK